MTTAVIDTYSREWMLVCLARHICRLPGKAARLGFIEMMRKYHGAEFINEIQNLVREQWRVMHAPAAQGEVDNGNT